MEVRTAQLSHNPCGCYEDPRAGKVAFCGVVLEIVTQTRTYVVSTLYDAWPMVGRYRWPNAQGLSTVDLRTGHK